MGHRRPTLDEHAAGWSRSTRTSQTQKERRSTAGACPSRREGGQRGTAPSWWRGRPTMNPARILLRPDICSNTYTRRQDMLKNDDGRDLDLRHLRTLAFDFRPESTKTSIETLSMFRLPAPLRADRGTHSHAGIGPGPFRLQALETGSRTLCADNNPCAGSQAGLLCRPDRRPAAARLGRWHHSLRRAWALLLFTEDDPGAPRGTATPVAGAPQRAFARSGHSVLCTLSTDLE